MNLHTFREDLLRRLNLQQCLRNRLVNDIRNKLFFSIGLAFFRGLRSKLLESE
jgi:hypothetical protein